MTTIFEQCSIYSRSKIKKSFSIFNFFFKSVTCTSEGRLRQHCATTNTQVEVLRLPDASAQTQHTKKEKTTEREREREREKKKKNWEAHK